jgi:hypothetical protein
MRRFGLAGAGVLVALAGPAPATELGNYPYVSGTVPITIESDFTYRAPGVGESVVTTVDIEPDVTVQFLTGRYYLTLYGQAAIQSVKDPNPGEDATFKDTGLFVQNLNLKFGNGRWEALGGKFTPNFGLAANLAPDIFAQDYASDYQYDEQIGLTGFYTLGDGRYGFHRLTVATFFQDTSVLSESAFTNRGRNSTADGGPGNTGDLSSFSVTYDGLGIVFPRGQLDYQLGFVYRGEGSGPQDETAEKGFVAAVSVSFPLINDVLSTAAGRYVELNPIVEYARFWDADGIREQTRDYLTVAANFLVGGWTFGAGYVWRQTSPPSGGRTRDYFYTVQAGYQFVNQLQVELGWKYGKEEGQEAQVLALTVAYEWDW